MKNKEKRIKESTILTIRKLIKERRFKTPEEVKKCQEYKDFMNSSKVNKYEREKENIIIDGILKGHTDDEIMLMAKPEITEVPVEIMEEIENLHKKTNGEEEKEMSKETKVANNEVDELVWFAPKDGENEVEETNVENTKEKEEVEEISIIEKLEKLFTELEKEDLNIDDMKEIIKNMCEDLNITVDDDVEVPEEIKVVMDMITKIIVGAYNDFINTDSNDDNNREKEVNNTDKDRDIDNFLRRIKATKNVIENIKDNSVYNEEIATRVLNDFEEEYTKLEKEENEKHKEPKKGYITRLMKVGLGK